MKRVIIDGNEIIGMSDIHRIFANELNFPEYYGKNLDALNDCLGEVSEEVEIVIEKKAELTENLGVSFKRLCTLLNNISEENKNIKVII